MKYLGVLFIAGLMTTGCSIETTVEDLKPMAPAKSSANPFGIRVSGGSRQDLTGPNLDLEISVGVKDRVIEGTNVEAQISISSNRPEIL